MTHRTWIDKIDDEGDRRSAIEWQAYLDERRRQQMGQDDTGRVWTIEFTSTETGEPTKVTQWMQFLAAEQVETFARTSERVDTTQPIRVTDADTWALDHMAAVFRADNVTGADGYDELRRIVAATGRDTVPDNPVE